MSMPEEGPAGGGSADRERRSDGATAGAGAGREAAGGRSSAAEPVLVLLAAPLLLLAERLPVWLPPLGLAWIGLVWTRRRARTGRWSVPTILDAPVLALLCTLPGAVFVAPDTAAALSRAYSLLFAIGLAYAVANGVGTARRAWLAAAWLLLAGAALATFGVLSVDWMVKYPALGPVVGRLPRILESVPHATFGTLPGTRPAGVHPNNLAGVLVLFIPLAVACAVPGSWFGRAGAGRRGRSTGPEPSAAPAGAGRPPLVRAVAVFTLAVGGPVLVLTQSRGALLGLAIGLVALAGTLAQGAIAAPAAVRRHGGLIGGVLAVIGVLGIGVAFAVAGLQSDRPELLPEETGGAWYSPSASGRLGLWQDGLAMLSESPITGIGLHNFPIVHGTDPELGVFVYQGFAHVHNQVLQAALDFGLPGAVAVVGLFVSVGWAVHRIRRHVRGGDLDPLVVGVAMGLLAHVVHGLVDAVAIGAKPGFLPWAMAGLVAAMRPRAHTWVAPAPAPAKGIEGRSERAGSADLSPPPGDRIIDRQAEERA